MRAQNHTLLFFLTLLFGQCGAQTTDSESIANDIVDETQTPVTFVATKDYTSGAMQTELYMPLVAGKKVGIVTNQTGIIGGKHLVDSLVARGIDVVRIFTPEHGFRGNADAGAKVNSGRDEATGIEIASLYGKTKKPTPQMLDGIDIILFDLQDVGVRFYTYISTLAYVMEAAAENHIPVVVLDRPNPNGFYVDGPVLKKGNASFVGMHAVPVVYGMTIGEYGYMVNGEGWLNGGVRCDLTVIPMPEYHRTAIYELPVKPSPNLPDWQSIYLYPTLCFFEGTEVSVGRGTDKPFRIYGSPDMDGPFSFTPESKDGASKPKHEGQVCHGYDKTEYAEDHDNNIQQLQIEWIADACSQYGGKTFFGNYFRLLAGNDEFSKQIKQGLSPDEIRESWREELESFKKTRAKYLIYDDFE